MPGLEILSKVEWFDDRFYKVQVDGEIHYLVSVTTYDNVVNKPFLNNWRGDVGSFNAQLRMAIAIQQGNNVHNAIERMLKGETITLDHLSQEEFYKTYLAKQWLECLNPTIERIEYTVFNIAEQYAGTVDVLIKVKAGDYMVNGSKPVPLETGYYVVDWKTGKSITDSAYRQQAAYYKALKPILKDDLKGSLIVHLGSSTRRGIAGLSTIALDEEKNEEYFKDFQAVKTLWRRLNPNVLPKIFDMPSELKLTLK